MVSSIAQVGQRRISAGADARRCIERENFPSSMVFSEKELSFSGNLGIIPLIAQIFTIVGIAKSGECAKATIRRIR